MGQGTGAGRDRLSRRQRRDLDRLEQELVADVHLCRWFDRLASDEPPALPGRDRRSAAACERVGRPRGPRRPGREASSRRVFVALVLAGAALTAAGGVLHVPTLAVPAMIVFMLAPVSVLVAEGRRRPGGPATRPGRRARPGSTPGLVRRRDTERDAGRDVVAAMTRLNGTGHRRALPAACGRSGGAVRNTPGRTMMSDITPLRGEGRTVGRIAGLYGELPRGIPGMRLPDRLRRRFGGHGRGRPARLRPRTDPDDHLPGGR